MPTPIDISSLMGKPRIPYFIFQLVAIRPVTITKEGEEPKTIFSVKEVEALPLVTKPSAISYNYRGTAKVTPTLGGRIFSDKSGIMLVPITIQGASGSKPRRLGLAMVDGWTRLKMFRERIMKLSNTVDKERAAQLLYNVRDTSQVFSYGAARKILGDDVVYAVNWYDFWHDEYMCVDIQTFQVSSQAQRGFGSTYNIQMMGLGDPVDVKTRDGLLLALMTLQWIENGVGNAAGQLNAWLDLSDSPIAKVARGIAVGGQTILDSMEVGTAALGEILNALPVMSSTLSDGAITSASMASSQAYYKAVASA